MYPSKSNFQAGFTLVEVVISIAILAILMSIAVPSYRSYIHAHQTVNISTDLFSELRRLRQLAVSQASNIVVCASSDQSTCLADTSKPNNWSIGWIAFSDLNSNQQRESATEDILTLQMPIVDGDLTYSDGAVLTFDFQGEALNSAQFNICSKDKDASLSRAIIVNRVGRVQAVQSSQLTGGIVCS